MSGLSHKRTAASTAGALGLTWRQVAAELEALATMPGQLVMIHHLLGVLRQDAPDMPPATQLRELLTIAAMVSLWQQPPRQKLGLSPAEIGELLRPLTRTDEQRRQISELLASPTLGGPGTTPAEALGGLIRLSFGLGQETLKPPHGGEDDMP